MLSLFAECIFFLLLLVVSYIYITTMKTTLTLEERVVTVIATISFDHRMLSQVDEIVFSQNFCIIIASDDIKRQRVTMRYSRHK